MARNKRNRKGNDEDRERSTRPHRQPGGAITDRNNNEANATQGEAQQEPNVERASDAGIGDAAVNDRKLSRYRSNRSTDA